MYGKDSIGSYEKYYTVRKISYRMESNVPNGQYCTEPTVLNRRDSILPYEKHCNIRTELYCKYGIIPYGQYYYQRKVFYGMDRIKPFYIFKNHREFWQNKFQIKQVNNAFKFRVVFRNKCFVLTCLVWKVSHLFNAYWF